MRPQIARARELRRDATPAERLLWRAIRNRGLRGAKSRRQMPCGPWIADFAFPEYRLIVEADGETHTLPDQAARDARRTAWLGENGWRILRFSNRDVLGNLDGVLQAIGAALDAPATPHPGPLPKGEGEGPPSPSGRGPG